MNTNETIRQEPQNRMRYSLPSEEGEYIATLISTMWGKRMRLKCYFETEDGEGLCLLAWRKQSGELEGQYCPRDSGPDFHHIEPGTIWLITTKRSKYGNVFWSTAEELIKAEYGGDTLE